MVTSEHDGGSTVAEIEQRLALRDLSRHDSAEGIRADDECVVHRGIAIHHRRRDIAGQYPARAAIADLERVRVVAAKLTHDRGRRTPVAIVVIAAGNEDDEIEIFSVQAGLGQSVSCRRQPHGRGVLIVVGDVNVLEADPTGEPLDGNIRAPR